MNPPQPSKFFKRFKLILSVLLVGLLSFVVCYDRLIFSKFRDYFDQALVETKPEYINSPEQLKDIVYLAIGKQRVRSHLIQMTLINQLEQNSGMIDWHANYFLCDLLVRVYYSEEEIFLLWCIHAPYEEGAGLNQSAMYRFDRELKDLNLEELSRIVVIARAPARYGRDSKQLDSEVEKLLANYNLSVRQTTFSHSQSDE